MNLQVELTNVQVKMKRLQGICGEKSAEIKRLKNLVSYYQKRTSSMKDIINNLKQQKFRNEDVLNAEDALNVRINRN